jgi:hypothetical protein
MTMTIPIILLAVLCFLNVVDYVQTVYAIQLFGLGVELNPIIRFLFEKNCEWIKLVIAPILAVTMGLIIKLDKNQIWVVWVLLALYLGIVVNNFIVLIQMGAF